jgi:hypothetical protein
MRHVFIAALAHHLAGRRRPSNATSRFWRLSHGGQPISAKASAPNSTVDLCNTRLLTIRDPRYALQSY